jgi:hypothetical protein
MFRNKLSVPSSSVKKPSTFLSSKMGSTVCPETSVRNYHSALRNIPVLETGSIKQSTHFPAPLHILVSTMHNIAPVSPVWVQRHVTRQGTDVLVSFLFIAAVGSDGILTPSLPPEEQPAYII